MKKRRNKPPLFFFIMYWKIVNTTPHDIKLILDNREVVYPKSSNPIRLEEESKLVDILDVDIPIYSKIYKSADLPPEQSSVYYIVSLIVAQSFPERRDFLIVNDTIRNDKGQIIGCRSFARV